MKKVLLAYDGSESSKKALVWLADFAKQTPVKIVIANVFHFPGTEWSEYVTSGTQSAMKALLEKAERVLDEGKKMLLESGLIATGIFLEGYPATEIIRYAAEESIDLIICGSRGLGGFESLLIGSVAQNLVAHSSVPVLVVRK
jgi:nucleotide-binding universal stress UspA family protein